MLATVLLAVFILVTGNTSFLLNAVVTNPRRLPYVEFPGRSRWRRSCSSRDDPAVGERMNPLTLFLLGVVDRMGCRSSGCVPRLHLARADDPPVRPRRDGDPVPFYIPF
ncbi:hypothetical protein HBB16_21810 [Pseudonocardia sp. MCCB 268]|nr:hypothetical protein [Pseudonocardia cytotoxica]